MSTILTTSWNLKNVKVELRIRDGRRTMRGWASNPCSKCSNQPQVEQDGCCMSYEQYGCDPYTFNGF